MLANDLIANLGRRIGELNLWAIGNDGSKRIEAVLLDLLHSLLCPKVVGK